jgi:hypothetical protein
VSNPGPEILDASRRQPSRGAVEAPDSAIVDDERALERRGPVDLMQVPRLLGNALGDIRTIAEGMATLPQLLFTLRGIQAEVEVLSDEVKRMRAAVEAMGGDVGELRGGMEDVNQVAHPLRRLTDRRRRDGA